MKRPSMRHIIAFAVWWLLSAVPTLNSQGIPRSEYLRFLPLRHNHVNPETRANDEFKLFGDTLAPSYEDVEPTDGIDDSRARRLMSLAGRFAPYLLPNTESVPCDFRLLHPGSPGLELQVDEWNISVNPPRLDASSAVSLAPQPPKSVEAIRVDEILMELMSTFFRNAADQGRLGGMCPEADRFRVLFFDFPGTGVSDWKKEVRRALDDRRKNDGHAFPTTFVHPFIVDAAAADSQAARYELVLQYWFFYPYNDAGNNHEGDWEHINVVISPLSRVADYLDRNEVAELLSAVGDYAQSDEQLVIKRVEYFFHHSVTVLDYSCPNVYMPRGQWLSQMKEIESQLVNQGAVWRSIRRLAYWDDEELEVNTHPIGYIGGDAKGISLLLNAPGQRDQSSNGSFPLPGLYKDVGPGGISEDIVVKWDHRGKRSDACRQEEYPRRGDVVTFDDESRIVLLPDWERLAFAARKCEQVRREWAWFLLPVRFGYPAAVSPLAGIVRHAETGNLAPYGPAYSSGWNRCGATLGFGLYSPQPYLPVFPLGWTDNFYNNMGFFNTTVPTLISLPPMNFIYRLISTPVRLLLRDEHYIFFAHEAVPERFFAIAVGTSYQAISEEFTKLVVNDKQLPELLASLAPLDSIPGNFTSESFVDHPVALTVKVPFFIGRRFVTENALYHSRSKVGLLERNSNGEEIYRLSALLNKWELSGSLRVDLLKRTVRLFAKGGYGWSWYRLEDTEVNGQRFVRDASEWIRKPSLRRFSGILPNTWHLGIGIEVVRLRPTPSLPGGIDFSLRAETNVYIHKLGSTKVGSRQTLALFDVADPTIVRPALDIVAAIGF